MARWTDEYQVIHHRLSKDTEIPISMHHDKDEAIKAAQQAQYSYMDPSQHEHWVRHREVSEWERIDVPDILVHKDCIASCMRDKDGDPCPHGTCRWKDFLDWIKEEG